MTILDWSLIIIGCTSILILTIWLTIIRWKANGIYRNPKYVARFINDWIYGLNLGESKNSDLIEFLKKVKPKVFWNANIFYLKTYGASIRTDLWNELTPEEYNFLSHKFTIYDNPEKFFGFKI